MQPPHLPPEKRALTVSTVGNWIAVHRDSDALSALSGATEVLWRRTATFAPNFGALLEVPNVVLA